MLKITRGSGFQLTFSNGNTVSVQWGKHNYCDRRYTSDAPNGKDCWTSGDAEVAAWDKDKNWHHFYGDTVQGYLNANEVAGFIDFVATNKLDAAPREWD